MSCTFKKAVFYVNTMSLEFPTRSDRNQAVKPQSMIRDLKFRLREVEKLFYLCSESKGADQLHGYRVADLRLCIHKCQNRFSNDSFFLNCKLPLWE